MAGMYGIGWILVVHVTEAGKNPTWAQWILLYQDYFLMYVIGCFLLLVSVPVGWYLAASIWRRKQPPVSRSLTKPAHWSNIFWALLALAVLTAAVYAEAYGGFLGQFEYSTLIRSGLFDLVPSNPFSFLRPFASLAMISSFGFFGLWISKERGVAIRLGFILSFLFSLTILFGMQGRMGFLVFLASFPLALGMYRSLSPLRLIAIGGIAFMGLLVGAYGLSGLLDLKSADNFLEFLARELSFPFGSLFAQISHGEHHFRGFIDFLWVPAYLLPSSWWMNWFEPVSHVNTAIILGAPKGAAGVTGSIPVDLLTLGIMQAHLPGVFITGMLFGALLRGVHNILGQIACRGVRVAFEANLVFSLAVLSVFYSQPSLVIVGHIHWIATAIILIGLFGLLKLGGMVSKRHSSVVILP